MADPFQPQLQGRRLQLSARTFNGLQKAGQDYSRRKLDENQTTNTPGVPQPVRIFNSLNVALDAFNVVQTDIAEAALNAAAVPLDAADAPILNALTPVADGRPFFVTREAIPVGGIGEVSATGPAVVWVDVTDESHTFATVSAGVTECLVSSASEGVPILWKDSGTGLKIAQVMLGATTPAVNIITNSSGSDYTKTGWNRDLTPIAADASRLYLATFFLSAPSVAPLSLYLCVGMWDANYLDPNAAPFIVCSPGVGFNSMTTSNAGQFSVHGYLPATTGYHAAPLWKVVSGTPSSIGTTHFSHQPATY